MPDRRAVVKMMAGAVACSLLNAESQGNLAMIQQVSSLPKTQSLEERLAAQQEIFDAQWEEDLKLSPENATAFGDYRFNNLLSDYSLRGIERQHAADEIFRARLAAISTRGFSDRDRLSHDLLLRLLEQRNADYALKIYEMPVSQMQGVHLDLSDLPNSVPLDTIEHYRDYIARLYGIPKARAQTIEVLKGREGRSDAARILLAQIPAQCAGIIADDDFLKPTRQFPSAISPAQRKVLTREITQAVETEVLPAYRRFAAFITKEYAPNGRSTIGMSSLPNGLELYRNAIREQTTSDLNPADIHALGLREEKRLNGLLADLAHEAGYTDLRSFRATLNADPKYVPHSAEQIVSDFRHYVQQMAPMLPRLFKTIPSWLVVPRPPAGPTVWLGLAFHGTQTQAIAIANRTKRLALDSGAPQLTHFPVATTADRACESLLLARWGPARIVLRCQILRS